MNMQIKLMSMIVFVLICILSTIVIITNANRDISYLNTKKNDVLEFRNKWLTFTGVNKSLLITDISEPVFNNLLARQKDVLIEITNTIKIFNSKDYLKGVNNELVDAYRNTHFIWDLSRENFNQIRLLLDSKLLVIIHKKAGYGSIVEIAERFKIQRKTKEHLKLNELINRTLALSSANDSFNNSLGKLITVINNQISIQESRSKDILSFASIFMILIVTTSLLLFRNQIVKNLKIVNELNQEIIERRLADDALRKSEKYNRMLFEDSTIGLLLCKMNGEFVDLNPAFASIVGRTVEETMSLSYWDITPEKYAKQEQEQLASLEKTGRYGPYEKEYIHVDGHLVPVRLSGLILDKDGDKYIYGQVLKILLNTSKLKMKESVYS